MINKSDFARDENGKLLIQDDTPDKKMNSFYRQKGGSLYLEVEPGQDVIGALQVCLEASKQEQTAVNYETGMAGITTITPEMSITDALNSFTCHRFIEQAAQEQKKGDLKQKIDKMKAQQDAPESIGFEDFYFLDEYRQSGPKKICDFCRANDIDPVALKMHYDVAIEYAESKGGSYETKVARGTEHFGLPELITKDNLQELKKKLVLSPDDPRVSETKQIKQQSRDYQQE